MKTSFICQNTEEEKKNERKPIIRRNGKKTISWDEKIEWEKYWNGNHYLEFPTLINSICIVCIRITYLCHSLVLYHGPISLSSYHFTVDICRAYNCHPALHCTTMRLLWVLKKRRVKNWKSYAIMSKKSHGKTTG